MYLLRKLCLASVILAAVASGSASAQEATAPADGSTPAALPTHDAVQYGIGIRLRNVRGPAFALEWFMESTPGGTSNYGIGVEAIRRRGNLELQLGFEYERITPAEGVYIESGKDVSAGDEADFIVSPDHNNGKHLGWITAEFTALYHTSFNKYLALRYGGGFGLGIVTGELGRYNVVCNGATNAQPEPGCVPMRFPNGEASPSPEGGDAIIKYDLPPVFPVGNIILGLQVRPMPNLTINIEGGIRTFPFFGMSSAYFF